MGKIRGASVLGTLEYARNTFGNDALARVIRSLPDSARQTLGDGVTTSLVTNGWYECGLVSDLTRELDRTCGKGDLAIARAVGRHVAFQDVNRFFKWLLRVTGPAMLFTRAGSVWKDYYTGGRYVFEGAEGKHASIRVEDWDCADPVICARVQGWMERALELTLGGSGRAVTRESAHLAHDTAVAKAPFCRYEAEWS